MLKKLLPPRSFYLGHFFLFFPCQKLLHLVSGSPNFEKGKKIPSSFLKPSRALTAASLLFNGTEKSNLGNPSHVVVSVSVPTKKKERMTGQCQIASDDVFWDFFPPVL